MNEQTIRHRYTDDVIAYVTARPRIWIEARELAKVGGFCAWRTRISEARKVIEGRGDGTIEWNGKTRESAYRYLPYVPLGPSAETDRSGQRTLNFRA